MLGSIEINQSEYINRFLLTLTEEKVEEQVNLYKTDPSKIKTPIKGTIVINIEKLFYKDKQNNNHHGISIFTIHIDKILKKFQKLDTDEFFINLKDNECSYTNKKIPYSFHYKNKILKIL